MYFKLASYHFKVLGFQVSYAILKEAKFSVGKQLDLMSETLTVIQCNPRYAKQYLCGWYRQASSF